MVAITSGEKAVNLPPGAAPWEARNKTPSKPAAISKPSAFCRWIKRYRGFGKSGAN